MKTLYEREGLGGEEGRERVLESLFILISKFFLFFSFADQSNFLIDHVTNSSLYVRIAWLGPNLNTEFVRSNLRYPGGRSILFYHYTPDVLLRPFDLTTVAFPSCADHIEVTYHLNFFFFKMENVCIYLIHYYYRFETLY